jgi:hypothetical protein
LRRHALEEYNELYSRETQHQSQSTQANIQDIYESKNRKKKNKKKKKTNAYDIALTQ